MPDQNTGSADMRVRIQRETSPGTRTSHLSGAGGELHMTTGASGAVPGLAWRNTRFRSGISTSIEVAAGANFDMVVLQIPLRGRWQIEYADAPPTDALPRLSRLSVPSAIFAFPPGQYAQFSMQVSLDTVGRWYGDTLPDGVRPLVSDRLRGNLHSEGILSVSQRRALQAALLGQHPLEALQIEGLSLQILGQFLQQLDGTVLEPGLGSKEMQAAREARELVTERLRDPPTLGELAAMTHVSARRLKIALREEFGQTLHQMVTEARFEEACAALRAGEGIKSIAFRLGYANVSAFGYAFRRRFGLSPAAWRERTARA
ncbi:helix-turn-helix domain-containing protein [Aquicoccus sp. SCR17]|nr:helix-turn-helix domain-containing protein [Carideicomes alvinocaridis]